VIENRWEVTFGKITENADNLKLDFTITTSAGQIINKTIALEKTVRKLVAGQCKITSASWGEKGIINYTVNSLGASVNSFKIVP
jgi:hypothetical protein